MADLTISSAATLTAATLATGDLIPVLDVSADAGSKGSNITAAELSKFVAISNPGVAYVQTNGNDSTGEIGNPAKPYLTAQAAFDDGARSFKLGNGVTSSLTHTVEGDTLTLDLFVRGMGAAQSVINLTLQSVDAGFSVTLRSDKTVNFNTVILSRGSTDSGTFNAENCYITSISSENTMEGGGGPTFLEGRIAFSEVVNDTFGGDALAIAYMSMIEGSPRLSPPS
jgi:hypothetical protein